jgi:hypothetical protein
MWLCIERVDLLPRPSCIAPGCSSGAFHRRPDFRIYCQLAHLRERPRRASCPSLALRRSRRSRTESADARIESQASHRRIAATAVTATMLLHENPLSSPPAALLKSSEQCAPLLVLGQKRSRSLALPRGPHTSPRGRRSRRSVLPWLMSHPMFLRRVRPAPSTSRRARARRARTHFCPPRAGCAWTSLRLTRMATQCRRSRRPRVYRMTLRSCVLCASALHP